MKQTKWLSEFSCLFEYTGLYPICFTYAYIGKRLKTQVLEPASKTP